MSDNTENSQSNGQVFEIQRIYIKDLSLEVPNSPAVFLEDWEPELDLDLENTANQLSEDTHEVSLKVTLTVKNQDKSAFLIEIQQAGIFTLQGFSDEEMYHLMGSYCPSVLYPYARECISETISKAGFPQFYLSPLNFDALLAEHDQRQGQSTEESSDESSVH